MNTNNMNAKDIYLIFQGCDLTKVKILKMGSGPGSPFGLEDKAP